MTFIAPTLKEDTHTQVLKHEQYESVNASLIVMHSDTTGNQDITSGLLLKDYSVNVTSFVLSVSTELCP